MQDITVASRADNGNYLSRCSGCIPNVYPELAQETVFVHVPEDKLLSTGAAHWKLQKLDNGKYALKADSGKYLARCAGGNPGAAKDLNDLGIFTHVTATNPDQLPDAAQFTLERLDFNGTYSLKPGGGNYLSRCAGCTPTANEGLKDQSIFCHAKTLVNPAKWTIIILP
jgi:hypothetical protein